jgi:hypothetical protein
MPRKTHKPAKQKRRAIHKIDTRKLNMKPLTGAALERAVKLARERGLKSL